MNREGLNSPIVITVRPFSSDSLGRGELSSQDTGLTDYTARCVGGSVFLLRVTAGPLLGTFFTMSKSSFRDIYFIHLEKL